MRSEAICHFHSRAIATRRKAWFRSCISRILFAAKQAKQSWMTVRMSRTLFVGSYLEVTRWALGRWKGKKIATNDKTHYQKKGFPLSLVLKVRVFGNRRWPIDKIFLVQNYIERSCTSDNGSWVWYLESIKMPERVKTHTI